MKRAILINLVWIVFAFVLTSIVYIIFLNHPNHGLARLFYQYPLMSFSILFLLKYTLFMNWKSDICQKNVSTDYFGELKVREL